MSKENVYYQLGANKDSSPRYEPYARGLYMVFSRELTDEQYLDVNMHAQSEMMKESEDYAHAKKCWDELPHTPERQLNNGALIADPISAAEEHVNEWLSQYEDYDDLVYAFDISRRLNLVTGETEPRIPELMEISFGMGSMSVQPFDEATEKDCVEYRIIYLFAEKV